MSWKNFEIRALSPAAALDCLNQTRRTDALARALFDDGMNVTDPPKGFEASIYLACISRMANLPTPASFIEQPILTYWMYGLRARKQLTDLHTAVVFEQGLDHPKATSTYLTLHLTKYYYGEDHDYPYWFPEENGMMETIRQYEPKAFRKMFSPVSSTNTALTLYACLIGHPLIIHAPSLGFKKMISDWAADYKKKSPHPHFEMPVYVE